MPTEPLTLKPLRALTLSMICVSRFAVIVDVSDFCLHVDASPKVLQAEINCDGQTISLTSCAHFFIILHLNDQIPPLLDCTVAPASSIPGPAEDF